MWFAQSHAVSLRKRVQVFLISSLPYPEPTGCTFSTKETGMNTKIVTSLEAKFSPQTVLLGPCDLMEWALMEFCVLSLNLTLLTGSKLSAQTPPRAI